MLILFHDAFTPRHETFLANLKAVSGDYIVFHSTSFERAKEVLDLYAVDFVSLDEEGEGGKVAEYIKELLPAEKPDVVNIHSYAFVGVAELEKQFKPSVAVWNLLPWDKKLFEQIKNLGERAHGGLFH